MKLNEAKTFEAIHHLLKQFPRDQNLVDVAQGITEALVDNIERLVEE